MESLAKIKLSPLYLGIAAFLLVIVILLNIFISDKKQYHNTKCTQAAYEILLGNSISSKPDAEDKKTQKDREKQHFDNLATCSDLRAQWRMATITERAYYVGLVGIFLIFATWIATREAVSVSRQSARDELRAYISVEGITSKEEDNGVKLTIYIKNVGQTPAKEVRMFRAIELGTIEQINNWKPPVQKHIEAFYGAVASGGVREGKISLSMNNIIDWPMTLVKMHDGNQILFVYGWVEYIDIYGVEQATFFRGYMAGKTAHMGVVQIADDGNEMT